MKKILVIIGGPTCIGKSEISIKLAKKFNSEIISSDSRQFYRELNIGVAKVPEKKLKEIKHHLINNTSIVNNYSIGDFQSDFYKVSKKIFKNKDLIFLCGGSGLYIDAVCKGFNKIPEINLKIRDTLNNDLKLKGLKNLTERLKKYDIKSWEKIDLKNPRKVIRCLEVYYSTNKPISSFYNEKLQEKEFECLYFSLNTKREFLYENINNRVEKMIAQGLENEVKSLIKFKNLKPLQTIGYKEFFEYFENKHSLENTISKIKQNTRRYAKRQITWFKSKKYLQVDISKIDLIEKIIKQKRGN